MTQTVVENTVSPNDSSQVLSRLRGLDRVGRMKNTLKQGLSRDCQVDSLRLNIVYKNVRMKIAARS